MFYLSSSVGELCLTLAICQQKPIDYKKLSIENGVETTAKIKNCCKNKTCRNKTAVKVNVNNQQSFNGIFVNKELYVPFSFLKGYYEIHGEFIDNQNQQLKKKRNLEFKWSLADPLALDPENLRFRTYSSHEIYLNFQESDVANRARVKCICGKHEVPITTQWDPNGYYYPTQIAQYGLSHISQYFAGDKTKQNRRIKLKKGLKGHQDVLVDENNLFLLKLRFSSTVLSSHFEVHVIGSDGKGYVLKYIKASKIIDRKKDIIIHDIGFPLTRDQLTRDLNVDLVKGLSFIDGKKQGNTVNIKIEKLKFIRFYHAENVKAVLLMNIDHVSMFIAAADWFINFQDQDGGWKTNISRVVFKGMKCDAGWYSAMGQGQAMSLLSRVYKYTDEQKYLDAALKAVKVFNIPSNKNGVLAMLFGKYPWYEEYPVTPSLFVLNGFLYSLFGLYDLYNTASVNEYEESKQLFQQGMETLEVALPLFDNGHGTFYDLRHVSIPGHPPNRARWQYHRVHLEQLDSLYQITKNQAINKTLHRWLGYASGLLSRHN